MNPVVEVGAYHGWGFAPSCWLPWKERFDSYSIPFTACDRGYFGEVCPAACTEPRFSIVLTHSYGLHWYQQCQSASSPHPVDLLIIFSSFLTFHPTHERQRRRSQRIVRQMMQECNQQLDRVVRQFYLNCGYEPPPNSPALSQLSSDRCVTDLQDLNQCHLDPDRLTTASTILIFHGTADQIVPIEQGRELVEQATQQTTSTIHSFEIEGAGHALPFTHAEDCWHLCLPFLIRGE